MKAGNYSIKWLYRHVPIVTYCDIYDNSQPDRVIPITTGAARCHSNDHFCREKGRKLSLARALKNANLQKEERKEIWESYRSMKPSGRW